MNLKHYLCFLFCSMLLLTMATGAVLATEVTPVSFNEAEIIQKYTETMFPILDQFRVTLDAYWNNQRIGYGTFGWNSGPSITGTVLSPLLNVQGSISFAFRPSGMSLLKTPDGETVFANLVSAEELMEKLFQIFSREFYTDFLDLATKNIRVVGTTTLNGRPVYILETDPNQVLPTDILDLLLSNPAFVSLLPEDVPVEEVREQAFAELDEIPTHDLPVIRSYIDMQDFLPLFDEQTFNIAWDSLNAKLAEQGGVALPQPKVSIGDIVVDDEGHISAITYRMSMDLPQSFLDTVAKDQTTDTAQVPEKDKMAFMLDVAVELVREAGVYLPGYFAVSVTIDATGWDVSNNVALALNPVQTHTVELVFEWDLARGADTSLLNNSKLITAERSWQEAKARLDSGDYEGAVAPIERLLSVAPSFTEGYVLLSNAYVFSDRNEQAIALLEMLVEIMPANLVLVNNLAYVYVDAEIDVERGLELITQLNDDMGGDMPAGFTDTLAWALYKNGKIEEAEAAMRLALERVVAEGDEEETATMYFHHAAILYAAGKYAEAKEAITLALRQEGATPEMYELEQRIDEELAAVTR